MLCCYTCSCLYWNMIRGFFCWLQCFTTKCEWAFCCHKKMKTGFYSINWTVQMSYTITTLSLIYVPMYIVGTPSLPYLLYVILYNIEFNKFLWIYIEKHTHWNSLAIILILEIQPDKIKYMNITNPNPSLHIYKIRSQFSVLFDQ